MTALTEMLQSAPLPVLIAGAVVLVSLLALIRVLRRFILAFSLALTALLLLHAQTAPAEASAALGGLAALVAGFGPLRRLILRSPF